MTTPALQPHQIGIFQRFKTTILPRIVSSEMARVVFRWLVVACQGATLVITWPLWETHRSPPMLPALPLPAFDMGLILFASLIVVLFAPRRGVILHSVLLIYAMLIDQTRMQPEIISLAFLMWSTLPNPNAQMVGRAHVVALWLWAGLNKLLSPGFLHGTGSWLMSGLLSAIGTGLLDSVSGGIAPWLRRNSGYLIESAELTIGLLALFPYTRIPAGFQALGVHAGILLTLSPLGHNWNQSVWPWNIALAFAGFALIWPWKESPLKTIAHCHPLTRVFIMVILLSPVGWFFGVTDSYLAHHLYSSDVPRVSASSVRTSMSWSVFKVPLPPEHRLFEQYFRLTCSPGDTMIIRDIRWWYRKQAHAVQEFACPDSG